MARVVMVLSENWTLTPPRDLRALVDMAVCAERAGVDTVMLSEHVVLGPSAGAAGRMQNPRDYAAPGNQDPATPWPDSIVLAAAIAAATSELRIALAAVIAPLRHPLLLAKQLATLDLLAEGRLVVQPTVSWAAEEYAALGVPFGQPRCDPGRAARGDARRLDARRPRPSPAPTSASPTSTASPSRTGRRGRAMWFGGQTLHSALIRRIVRYGSGFHPFGTPTDAELGRLREAMAAAGRDIAELELVGGIRGRFAGRRRRRRPRRGAGRGARASSPAASRRSASSRRCSPTIATSSARCAARVVERVRAAAAAAA